MPLRCHYLQRAEEGRVRLQFADRHLRRRRARPDGAVATGRWAARAPSSSISTRASASRRSRRGARHRRRQGARCAGQLAKKAGGPIRAVIDLVGNAQTTQLGFDCYQGRQARHRRPVRRRRALGLAADPDQGDHDPGQLCRKSARNRGIARPRPQLEDRADSVTTMPLAKANEALIDLQKGKLVGRAVLTP